MCELNQGSPSTVFVRKEACPVSAESENRVPGPGPCHGGAPGGSLRATGALRLRASGLIRSPESAITE